MKKRLFILIIILNLILGRSVLAQQAPNNPLDAAPAQPNQPLPANPNLTTATVKSNTLCVKVGTPAEDKPATCNQPIGNFTTIPGAGGFVHYCQNNNPAWPTSNGCTLAGSGCGPTSLAMAMSSFNAVCDGGTCTPAAVNKLMEAAGQRQPACNSVVNGGALESQWFKRAGMQTGGGVSGVGVNAFDFEAAKAVINRGYLIIGSVLNAPTCNGCNHIFVIQDVDPVNRTIHVRDPICKGNNQEGDVDGAYNNSIRAGILSWLYAVPVKGVQLQQGVQ